MTQTDLLRVKELFQTAADLPIEQRAAWLDRQDVVDSVREQVELQLRMLDSEADELVAAVARPAEAAKSTDDGLGETIDRYELIERIGEGGFGTVWRARQLAPVERTVALKVIKVGMDTRQVVARFEAERQALALMDHPDIAKVLDAGATSTGRPYFAMELVDGVPITEYCDRQGLGTKSRLALFQQVCLAVQHAHQKGVIHRDLKPSNILVADPDGEPRPKVIDFGIAKATASELTQKTLFTESQQMVGTPEYMSPEQAELSGLDVDTRADVYSLGVLLYEMLTGTLPFDVASLREQGYLEMLRVIREDEPPKPSTRVSTLGEALSGIAERRHSSSAHLGRLLRGDLDWIVLRALEKDRDRRYESAAALAADVGRHLQDEPVLAGPQTARYRLQRFVRKHRTGVLASTAVALALALGTVGAVWGLLDARRKQADLDIALRDSEAQRDAANSARNGAERAVSFLVDMIALANPDLAGGRDATADDILERATVEVARAFADQPHIEGRLRTAIGEAASVRGRIELAGENLLRALVLLESQPATTAEELYAVLWPLWLIAGQLDEGYRMVELRLIFTAQAIIGGDDPELLAAVKELSGVHRKSMGDTELDAALTRMPAATAAANFRRLTLADLMLVKLHGSEVDRPRWFEEVAKIHASAGLGPSNARSIIARLMQQWVWVCEHVGEFAKCAEFAKKTIELGEQSMPGHWYVDACHLDLGSSLTRIGRLAEARPHLEHAVRQLPAKLGPFARMAIWSRSALVQWYDRNAELRSSREAVTARAALCHCIGNYRNWGAVDWVEVALGPDHADLGARIWPLFELRQKPGEAVTQLHNFVTECRQRFQIHDPRAVAAATYLVRCAAIQSSDFNKAAPQGLRSVFEYAVEVLEDRNYAVAARALRGLAWAERELGNHERAANAAARGLAVARHNAFREPTFATMHGMCQFEIGNQIEGIAIAWQSYEESVALLGEDHGAVGRAFEATITMMRRSGKSTEAERLCRERIARVKDRPGSIRALQSTRELLAK